MEMLYNDFVIRIIKMKMCIDTMDMTSGSLGKRVFHFSIPLIICFLSGLLLLILGLGFSGILLKIMNTKEELIDGARLYLKVCFLGMSALAVYNFGNAVLSAMGDKAAALFSLYLLYAFSRSILRLRK